MNKLPMTAGRGDSKGSGSRVETVKNNRGKRKKGSRKFRFTHVKKTKPDENRLKFLQKTVRTSRDTSYPILLNSTSTKITSLFGKKSIPFSLGTVRVVSVDEGGCVVQVDRWRPDLLNKTLRFPPGDQYTQLSEYLNSLEPTVHLTLDREKYFYTGQIPKSSQKPPHQCLKGTLRVFLDLDEGPLQWYGILSLPTELFENVAILATVIEYCGLDVSEKIFQSAALKKPASNSNLVAYLP